MTFHGSAARSAETLPLVSILVPAYNHRMLVTECLDSIAALDYPNLELIVSDDGSSDGTFEVAEMWVKQNSARFVRAIAVRQPVNLKIVRNLQFLFDQARGEYLAYVASDDRLTPSSISERVAKLERERTIDALFGNAQQISAEGEILRERFIPEAMARQLSSRKLIASSLVLNWCVPGPVMMMRRAAVLEDGSLGRLPADLTGEDAYIYTRLAARGRIAFLDSLVAQWRYLPGSLSNRKQAYIHSRSYNLESDKLNRPLMRGFDRLAIDARIALLENEVHPPAYPVYIVMKILTRAAVGVLRLVLRVRAALHV